MYFLYFFILAESTESGSLLFSSNPFAKFCNFLECDTPNSIIRFNPVSCGILNVLSKESSTEQLRKNKKG